MAVWTGERACPAGCDVLAGESVKTKTVRDRGALDARSVAPRETLLHFPEIEAFPKVRADFSAVIFDFDGTLADSMWVWEQIDDRFCEKYGLVLPETYYDSLATMTFEQTARFFREELGVQMTVEEIGDEFNELAKESYARDVLCKTGAKEYLAVLKARGAGIAIATSLSWTLLELALESNGIAGYIDDIAFCDESAGKGQSDVYLLAAARVGARPADCLVFEDIVPGVLSAKRAGMTVGGMLDPHQHQDEAELRAAADFCITEFPRVP